MKLPPKLLVFTISLGLSLLAFEIGVRLADLDYNPNPYWRFHPRLGWTQEKATSFQLKQGDQDLTIEFNQLGFRDVEHAIQAAPNTHRIVTLGDSFSEAVQVNLNQTYWYQLATILESELGQPWEVINLGVGDWGNAQALLALREYGLAYQPDLVISQIFPLNDICNNSLEMAHLCKSQNDNYRPYLRLVEGSLEEAWTQPVRQMLRSCLISFGVVEKLLIETLGAQPEEDVNEKHTRLSQARGFEADPLLLTYASDQRQPPELQKAWKTTEAILAEVFRTCQEWNIPWVGFVIPFEGRVNDAWPSLAAALAKFELDPNYPEQRLTQFFRNLGAPALMLKPIFDARKDEILPYVGGHLNAAAHSITARALADFLIENRVLQ